MVIVTCKCLNITANISVSDKDVDLLAKPFPTNGGPVSPSATLVPNTLEFLKEAIGVFTNPAQLRIETKHDELMGCRRFQVTPHPHVGTANQLWTLVTCIICDQPVYATRASSSAIPRKSVSSFDDAASRTSVADDFAVVFNGKLLSTMEAINTLKLDEHYSKIYKVIIRQPSSSIFSMLTANASSPPKSSASHTNNSNSSDPAVDLINNSDPRLKNLTALLNERMRKETEATEERIRQFTADQFVALRVFRTAAEAEFVHLAQKLRVQPPNELLSEGDKKLISISVVGGNLLETPPLTPDSGTMTMNNSPPRLLNSVSARSLAPMIGASTASGAATTGVSGPMGRLNALWKRNSTDAGIVTAGEEAEEDEDDLFGEDGYFPGNYEDDSRYGREERGQEMSDCEEDFDEDDAMEMNGRATERYIPRRDRDRPLSGGMMIAKSLPIATPAIPDRMAVEKSEQQQLEDNVDIAASIKALAKSVHGADAIFGDLPRPRPRPRTQI